MSARERERLEAQLVDLLYDELPPDEAEAARSALAEHPDLQARLADYERVRAVAARVEEIEPDPQVRYALLRAARQAVDQRPSGFWAWLGQLGMAPALSAVAVVFLAVAGVLSLTEDLDSASAPEPPAAVTQAPTMAPATPATSGEKAAEAPAPRGSGAALEEKEEAAASARVQAEAARPSAAAPSPVEATPDPSALDGVLGGAPEGAAEPELLKRRGAPKAKRPLKKRRAKPAPKKSLKMDFDAYGDDAPAEKGGAERQSRAAPERERRAATRAAEQKPMEPRGADKLGDEEAGEDDGRAFAPPPPASNAEPAPAPAPVARPEPEPEPEPVAAPQQQAYGERTETVDLLEEPVAAGAAESGPARSSRAPTRDRRSAAGGSAGPQATPPVLLQARAARRAGNHRAAVQRYEQFLDGYRGHADFQVALFEAAQSHEELGDVPRALQLYRLVVANGGRYAGMAAKRIDRLTSLRAKRARPKAKSPPPAAFDEAEQAAEPAAEPEQAAPARE